MHSITLQTSSGVIVDGMPIGRLAFAASNEADAGIADDVVAKFEAVAEKTFDADENATEFVFYLAADGTVGSKMTLSSAGLLTPAGGITSTGAANTLGATSFNDANITNVGSIACDSVVVDAAAVGLDVVFGGNTTLNKMTLTDNLADALNVTESSNSYMKFVTTNNAERIITNVGVVSNPTALTGQSGSVIINAALGNYWTVATSSAITGLDIQNAIVGQKILIRFAWGGDHALAFASTTVIWPGGTEPSTTSGGKDVYGFLCTTASSAFDGFIIGEALA